MATACPPAAAADQPRTLAVRGWRAALPALLIGALLAALIFTQRLFGDGDTGWHLGAGNYILATRSIPHVEPFSFTFRGAPWTAHEWLSEVLMSLAFGGAGWSGLGLVFAAAAGTTLWLVARRLERQVPVARVLLCLVVLACLLLPAALARPHLLAWPLFAAWLTLLLEADEEGRAPPLATALLMILWANAHASYLLGLGIAGLFTVAGLWRHRRELPVARGWLVFGLAALAAAFVTPHGLQGFLYPFQVRGMGVLSIIDEWRPTSLAKDPAFVLFGLAAAGLAAIGWRRLGLVRLLVLAGLGAMAWSHFRHQPLFAIAALLILAPEIGRPSGKSRAGEQPRTGLMLLGIGALLSVVRLAVPYDFAPSANYPLAVIDALPAALKRQPVFNEYSMGGPLIMRGIAPAIDGRADVYGDTFTFAHLAMSNGDMPRFRAFVARHGVAWTIMPPGTVLARRLDHEPGWRRLTGDRFAVVHVRTR